MHLPLLPLFFFGFLIKSAMLCHERAACSGLDQSDCEICPPNLQQRLRPCWRPSPGSHTRFNHSQLLLHSVCQTTSQTWLLGSEGLDCESEVDPLWSDPDGSDVVTLKRISPRLHNYVSVWVSVQSFHIHLEFQKFICGINVNHHRWGQE